MDEALLQQSGTEPPTILRPPKNRDEARRIISGLHFVDRVKLCKSQDWCEPNTYPFCFMGQARIGQYGVPPVLVSLTACRHPHNVDGLKEFLRRENTIVVPKRIIIEDNERNVRIYLGPNYTRPRSGIFTVIETNSSYTISLQNQGGASVPPPVPSLAASDDEDGDDDDEDGDDDNVISFQPSVTPSVASPHPALQLIPDFFPGRDGLGEVDPGIKKMNLNREPWKYGNEDFLDLINIHKLQFFDLVVKQNGSQSRKSELNLFGEVFLWMFKLTKDPANEVLRGLFALSTPEVARQIFNRQNCFYYKNNINIPQIVTNYEVNVQERDKMLELCYNGMSDFHKRLANAHEDPDPDRNRPFGVFINVDATYFDEENSSDLELNKSLWYPNRSNNVVKLLNWTTMAGKFIAVQPLSPGASPTCGDGFVTQKFICLEDDGPGENLLRVLLKGNDRFFVICVSDAGFVVQLRNGPREVRDCPTLGQFCRQCGAHHIHTSTNFEGYIFERAEEPGKLKKVPYEEIEDMERVKTKIENTIKWTREFRMIQEASHANLKRTYSLLNAKKMKNSYLKPFSEKERVRYKLPGTHKNLPKLSIFALNCCSLHNELHAGYTLRYVAPGDQAALADNLIMRMTLENPLLYEEMWPVSLTGRGDYWTECRLGYLEFENDVLGFPKLNENEVNQIATRIVGGVHALRKTNDVITYINKLHFKESNLTPEQLVERCLDIPWEMKIEYAEIGTPDEFVPTTENPTWTPGWWDREAFGDFHDCFIVRALIPPSMKSATQKSNFHRVVIVFGQTPSQRLGQLPPYDRIYAWRCFSCPAKCGTMSMDRHCTTLLCLLSFPHTFRSMARMAVLLNPVALDIRQPGPIYPPSDQSADIPANILRKGHDRRSGDTFYPPTTAVSTGNPLLRCLLTYSPLMFYYFRTSVNNTGLDIILTKSSIIRCLSGPFIHLQKDNIGSLCL